MRAVWHWVLVGAAFAYVAGVVLLAFVVQTQTSDAVTGFATADGTTTSVASTQRLTLYEVDGTAVVVIVGMMALGCLVAAASVAYRVGSGSTRLGVSGVVAAAVLGFGALLGMLTVGPVLIPLVALVGLASLPIAVSAG